MTKAEPLDKPDRKHDRRVEYKIYPNPARPNCSIGVIDGDQPKIRPIRRYYDNPNYG